MNVKVVLVDDHNLVRSGLRSLLEGIPGIQVTGEASDGASALQIVREDAPDIVITDITMRGVDGVELALILRREFPEVRVIILSMHAGHDYVQQALGSGVSAYLIKDSAMQELELAIRAVMRGEKFLSSAVSTQVVDGFVNAANTLHAEALTDRQREILKLLAQGESAKEIAYALGIATKTVEAHRSQIMERLRIPDLAGLVKYALRVGLISDK